MNESASATVMKDSSGHAIDGAIGSAVRTGLKSGKRTVYGWPYVDPHAPPAKPERLVTADDRRLNPARREFAVSLRFRTLHPSGNIVQKGQSGSSGGFWKVETHRGKVTCLFRGRASDGSTRSKVVDSGPQPLDDGKWHTISCVRSSSGVTMTVDGDLRRHVTGGSGAIWNNVPLAIGGKLRCDQDKVSCDYFTGSIDYLVIQASAR